ncbi:Inner membrane transport protein YajR [Candidatus Ecksteinia adelgidicola]|nr:Inner membrane transport protein YajR [Candidatus Ecksteinia adelgidicola]
MYDSTMTALERRTTFGLSVILSLRMFGIFMVLPALTTYGMYLNGANKVLIGIAIGVYGLCQAIFQIPLGFISDSIGRKPIIIGGLIIFMFGSIIPIINHSIWGVILGRALQGAGTITSSVMALLSDLIREQNYTKAMAFIGINFGIIFTLSIVLGPIITHIFNIHTLFLISASLAFIGIILTLVIVPSSISNKRLLNRNTNIMCDNFLKVLKNKRLLKLNFDIMCLHVLLISIFIALPFSIEKAGLNVSEHWKIYLVTMLISFIIMIFVIIYAEKYRHIKQVFIGSIAILFFSETLMWLPGNHLWSVITGIQLFFIGFNIMEAILPSLISKESPLGCKGTAMGIYSTSQFIGVAIGGIFGGWLYHLKGTVLVFILGSILSFVWMYISRTMKEPSYFSSLKIKLSSLTMKSTILESYLKNQPGIKEVIIIPEEDSIYVKVDVKKVNRSQIEKLIF